jgi:hypothetical protein
MKHTHPEAGSDQTPMKRSTSTWRRLTIVALVGAALLVLERAFNILWPIWIWLVPSPYPTPAASSVATDLSAEKMPNDLIQQLVSPVGKLVSLRHAEKLLGTPVEETGQQRVYEKYGLRFTLFGLLEDKSYTAIEIGPSLRSNAGQNEVNLSGPWGKLAGKFGSLKFSDVDRATMCHRVSDINYGGNGACKNVFEVECAGSQAQGGFIVRAGVLLGCSYQEFGPPYITDSSLLDGFRKARNIALGAPTPTLQQLLDDHYSEMLRISPLSDTPINFFTISTTEREEPRAAGGG